MASGAVFLNPSVRDGTKPLMSLVPRGPGWTVRCSCGWVIEGVWTKAACRVWVRRHERKHETGVMIGGFHAHIYNRTYRGFPLCSFCGFIKAGFKGPKLGGMQ